MPRNGSTIPADLVGKLTRLRVECSKCGRAGRYRLSALPPDLMLTHFLSDLTEDCPRRINSRVNIYDQCGVRYPDLPRVLS